MNELYHTKNILLAYLRKSVVDDDSIDEATGELRSFSRQRDSIVRYAAANNYDVRWFEDVDISGRHEANRPGWLALLASLDLPGVAGVIVESYDRSHRNVREFLAFYDDQLQPRRLRLISATQQIDLSTSDGRAMASVIMAFSEMESRKAGERIKSTVAHLRATQNRYWGTPLFGTMYRDKQLVPSDAIYEINGQTRHFYDSLVALFKTYIRDIGTRKTAKILNDAGWRYWYARTHEPRLWRAQVVQDIVKKWPIYAGYVYYGKNRSTVPPPLRNGSHDPIIDPDLCHQAAEILRRRGRGKPGPARVHLLINAYCAQCGHKLRASPKNNGVFYTHQGKRPDGCNQRQQPAEPIEAAVITRLVEFATSPEIENAIRQRVAALKAALLDDATHTTAAGKLADLRQRLHRLEDIYLDGEIEKASYTSRRSLLVAEINAIERRLVVIETGQDIEQVITDIMSNLRQLDKADRLTQRNLVNQLFERIDLGNNEVARYTVTEWATHIIGEI